MKLGKRLAVAGLLFGLTLLSACSKGGGNPSAPNPPVLEMNSGNIAAGGIYQHTFANAGTFPYHCGIHGAMSGSVSVAVGGPANASVSIVNSTATGFSPSPVTVGIGGQVTWTNNHNTTHTVTSD